VEGMTFPVGRRFVVAAQTPALAWSAGLPNRQPK
jgi:hypothetical protein